jgi:hypothetical protein
MVHDQPHISCMLIRLLTLSKITATPPNIFFTHPWIIPRTACEIFLQLYQHKDTKGYVASQILSSREQYQPHPHTYFTYRSSTYTYTALHTHTHTPIHHQLRTHIHIAYRSRYESGRERRKEKIISPLTP